MRIYAPDYYTQFHCIAEKCTHTCCAGWEIDIDSKSLERYRTLKGPLAEELRLSIEESDPPHFRLTERERCPMLNEQGLCRLILHYGESALCQICTDHPRFRNFWSDRIEIGLGLVCEEAARLILEAKHPMRLILLENGDAKQLTPREQAVLRIRNQLLEQVPEHGPAARLHEYLIYRHIADAVYDGRLFERIRFVKHAFQFMMKQWTDGKAESLEEIARRFSDTVEYDSDVLNFWITSQRKQL